MSAYRFLSGYFGSYGAYDWTYTYTETMKATVKFESNTLTLGVSKDLVKPNEVSNITITSSSTTRPWSVSVDGTVYNNSPISIPFSKTEPRVYSVEAYYDDAPTYKASQNITVKPNECEKSLTPTDLNPLIDLLSTQTGFKIQSDNKSNNQSKLLSDLEEFNDVLKNIKNQQTKITEIQNSNEKNKDKKIATLQVKLNNFITRKDAIKQIITDKVSSLESQANSILSQANTLSPENQNIDLTSSSTTPLGVYKDKIQILSESFNDYVTSQNTYDLVTALKIYVQEVYLYKELMTKYLNQEIQDDISLNEKIENDDDDDETQK